MPGSCYQLRSLFGCFFAWVFLLLAVSCTQPVQDRPILRVGTSGDYEPFSVLDETGQYTGFDIELTSRFAEDQGYELQWVPFSWPNLVADLNAGKFDLAMSGITVRADRSLQGQFTLPTTTSGAVVLLPNALAVQETGQLDQAGITIGVNRGGHLERVTRQTFTEAVVVTVSDNQSLPDLLLAGEIDCLVTDTMEAPFWLERLPEARALAPFTQDLKAGFVAAEKADLADSLNRWLMSREREGRLSEWRKQFLPPGNDLQTATPLVALMAAMRERLSLMVAVAEAKRVLGRPVEDLEQEARVLQSAVQGVQEAAVERGIAALNEREIRGFFQIQMDVAKAIQVRTLQGPVTLADPPDLVDELRPALARISRRMNGLLLDLVSEDSFDPAELDPLARDMFGSLPVLQEEVSKLVGGVSLLLE